MATVTHLISILAAALLAMAILWGEHYTPWTPRLDVRLNYVLGTLAMLVPYSLLLTLWAVLPSEMTTVEVMVWALVALWVIVACSGLVVHAMHEADASRDYKARAEAAEMAEQVRRESTQEG